MDLDTARYSRVPKSSVMISENDTEILDFITKIAPPSEPFDHEYAGSFFYRKRFYLLLFFLLENEKRFLLFRMDRYRKQSSEYATLETMIERMVPYGKTGSLRELAISIVEFVKMGTITRMVRTKRRIEPERRAVLGGSVVFI